MPQSDGRQPTLLVVDDEPAILRMLVEKLKGSTFRVLTATHGAEALALYRQHPGEIDLVLLDLQMQPQSGLEVLDELRRIDPGVRVAIMSGSPSEARHDERRDTGALTIFPKPFTSLTDLVAAIRNLIEQV